MIATHKGEIPFIVLLLPFLAGIGLGLHWSSASFVTFLYAALFLLTAVFVLLNVFYKKLNIYKLRWLGGLLIHSLLFVLGWMVITQYLEINNNDHFSKRPADELLVKVNNEPVSKNGIIRLTASVEQTVYKGIRTKCNGTLLIAIKDSAAGKLYYGDELLIPASYHSIDPPPNPAEFNYKRYLANQNIYYQEFLYPHQYYVLNKDAGNAVVAYSLRLRQKLVEKFKADMHDPEAIAVASTLILGYKADLSNDVLQAYSKTGTVHVLSVSGAHVAILFALLSFVLGFMDRFRYGKSIKAVIIISLIWYYALLTGFSPAVCRAAVMISMFITGKTYSRHINTLNILAVSAFFILLYDPLFITDVGFQLSYLAVFGLIILQPVVYNLFDIKNKWADKLWALCSVSIAAQVITFPLSAFYFHQFPVYFLVSNLFIIIPSAIIMYSGIAYLLLPHIPFVSATLAFVLEKSILLMNKVLAVIEYTPFASINKIWITTVEYLLLYAIIISIFYFLYDQRKWLLKFCLGCTLLFTISISIKRWHHLQADGITFLNLRKHTGIVFKNQDHAVVITDLPDTDKVYKYSIQPYLDSLQATAVSICNENADIKLSYLVKKGALIQCKSKIVYLVDRQQTLPEKLSVDYLYITGTPHTDLDDISKYFNYHLLILGNNNSPQYTKSIENETSSTKANFRSLRRNNHAVMVSN